MREIDLDAASWNGVSDFYQALLPALGAPDWHGKSVNALIDSMIWGGINAIAPPYVIQIHNTRDVPNAVKDEITLAIKYLAVGREDFRKQEQRDIDVSLNIVR